MTIMKQRASRKCKHFKSRVSVWGPEPLSLEQPLCRRSLRRCKWRCCGDHSPFVEGTARPAAPNTMAGTCLNNFILIWGLTSILTTNEDLSNLKILFYLRLKSRALKITCCTMHLPAKYRIVFWIYLNKCFTSASLNMHYSRQREHSQSRNLSKLWWP